ncbi:MAG: hypothetical protein GY784_06275 [Gammaproteobacteria bacterium]|nr:hypothetical protein [Gammaproteobacteria bacterium]
MMKIFRTLTLLLAGLTFVSAVVAADTRDQKITAEVNALVEGGMTLKDAATTLSLKYKDEISKDPEVIAEIYNAISIAADAFNIDSSSTAYTEAVAATSNIMINEHGISEAVVINATVLAGIDTATVISTLPSTAFGASDSGNAATTRGTQGPTPTGIISAVPATTGGGVASPAS